MHFYFIGFFSVCGFGLVLGFVEFCYAVVVKESDVAKPSDRHLYSVWGMQCHRQECIIILQGRDLWIFGNNNTTSRKTYSLTHAMRMQTFLYP